MMVSRNKGRTFSSDSNHTPGLTGHTAVSPCPSSCHVLRFSVWPKVREFLESLPPCSVVADVGCGNGKYFGVRDDLMVLGSDRSAGEDLGVAGVAWDRELGLR